MTSISCITRLLTFSSKENGRILVPGRLSSLGLGRSVRGAKSIASSEKENPIEEDDQVALEEAEVKLNKLRDISRLKPRHRNLVNRIPAEERSEPCHHTVLWNRKMFGRYGYASGVNPSICWPTKEELKDKIEYENIAYPHSILEVAEREQLKKEAEEKQLFERDAQIEANVKAMDKMKKAFLEKQEKLKAEADAAKAFRTRLIEEVRLHFNYTINERDERFRLELKERAKQLKEKEKQERKALKKEKQASQKITKFEEDKKRLLEEEAARKSAPQ